MAVIAIAPCSKLPDYEESVRRAGGAPRVLHYATDSPADVVRGVGGLLLAGGNDVLPSIYGEAAHQTFEAAEAGRDEYELELVRRARDADLPVFAICRGIQLLNVAHGGTLIQDIPSQLTGALEHRLAVPPHQPFDLAHEIWIEKDSRLAKVLGERLEGSDSCEVNSRHHQALKTLGEGLVTTATAPDGVIEAVEDPTRRFWLGVQWHPENFWRTGEFRSLFEAFITAARR
ncbi:MAG: gamma-glutamyl-gamma-aminobutyrate hydrolase family protein [Acidimicrobiia bacterium]|nr:gamma-glutamyl-gamma-aminobutyrate hydrolase family protein [Acidimicrobiia bacterium]